MRNNYFIYLLTNRTHTLYIGVTDNLEQRLEEHRAGFASVFTAKYKIHRLVYFEQFDDIVYAIAREKQLKGWLRRRKIELIESMNPRWTDLSLEMFPSKGHRSP